MPFVLFSRELSFDTSLALGGDQKRKISKNALRFYNFDVCGPISNLTVFSTQDHRKEALELSPASGGALDRRKQLCHTQKSKMSKLFTLRLLTDRVEAPEREINAPGKSPS